MKYSFKNFIRIFQNDKLIATLAILCVVASVIIMHFGYGLYQNYNALLLGEKSGMTKLEIKIREDSQAVTKKELLDCIKALSFNTQNNIHDICAYPAVTIEMKEADKIEDYYLPVICYFSVSNGKIIASKYLEKIHANQGTKFGSFFSDEDFSGNKKSALFDRYVFERKVTYDKVDREYLRKQIQFNNPDAPMGYDIKIQGELYQVIGSMDKMGGAVLPITQLNDDTIMQNNVFIGFGNDAEKSFITREQYNDIRDSFLKHFGNEVEVPDIPLPDIELQRLYRTVILIAGLIALIAGFNFTQLYLYILEKRRKRIAIMQICGCSKRQAAEIFLTECMMFMLPSYLVSYLVFRYGILPQCSQMFPFMIDSFSPNIYLALFGIFMIISLIELNVMIMSFLAGNDIIRKERGR